MTRTTAREIAVQLVFSQMATGEEPEKLLADFFDSEHFTTLSDENELFTDEPDKKQMAYITKLVTLCAERRLELDGYIGRYSKDWKPERISRTASAVLRCALCEILYMDDAPAAAAINEAVELAKGYDEPETVAFINGVLGGFMRGERAEEAETPETASEEV